MKDIISAISPTFPQQIKEFDDASYSLTKGSVRILTLDEANNHPAAIKHGIKVIAACNPDATNDCYLMYVGIDQAGTIYHTSLMHGKSSWHGLTDDEQKITDLTYEMEFRWCVSGSDGPMWDEYWSDLASIGIDEEYLYQSSGY